MNFTIYWQREKTWSSFFSGPEDPKIHDQVLGYLTVTLSHLLHPNTLQRIIDSELYGNQYKLTEFMTDLNSAIFDADIKNNNINTFRQNLQATYVSRLIEMVLEQILEDIKIPAKSMAIYNLEKLSKKLKSKNGNLSTLAHKNHLKKLIDSALDNI